MANNTSQTINNFTSLILVDTPYGNSTPNIQYGNLELIIVDNMTSMQTPPKIATNT